MSILADATNIANSGWSWLAGQGVLAGVLGMLYREYREEKAANKELNNMIVTQIVPLVTRATESMEKLVARAEMLRPNRSSR